MTSITTVVPGPGEILVSDLIKVVERADVVKGTGLHKLGGYQRVRSRGIRVIFRDSGDGVLSCGTCE